jgi:hypothetical protein
MLHRISLLPQLALAAGAIALSNAGASGVAPAAATATAPAAPPRVAAVGVALVASSVRLNASAAGRSHRWFPHLVAVPMARGPPALLGKTETDDDGACGGLKPCLPGTQHLSTDGGTSFAEVAIAGLPAFNATRAVAGGRPKHGGGLNMFYLLPTGAPGALLALPGAGSGLASSDGSTGVHTDLARGSAWSDAGGALRVSASGVIAFAPTRTNFTFSGFPPNTSCWPPGPYWRTIALPDGRRLGVANPSIAGPRGYNKAMVAVVSSDGVNWRYLSTVANGSEWSSGPLAEGFGEHSCALTPQGRVVVVWRTNGGHHRAIGPSGPGLLPYNTSLSTDAAHTRWTAPAAMRDVGGYTMGAAQPQLLALPAAGAVLLSGGRSGSFLWRSADGVRWATTNLALAHNKLRRTAPKAYFTAPWTERNQPAAYNHTKGLPPARGSAVCQCYRLWSWDAGAARAHGAGRLCPVCRAGLAGGGLFQPGFCAEHGVHLHLRRQRERGRGGLRPARRRLVGPAGALRRGRPRLRDAAHRHAGPVIAGRGSSGDLAGSVRSGWCRPQRRPPSVGVFLSFT